MAWYDESIEGTIAEGCAGILWGLAWADHAEETDCCSLSGRQIEDHMPAIGEMAFYEAGQIIGALEQASGYNILALFSIALRDDGLNPETAFEKYAERFGNCLAYGALGHGVAWSDDHATCERLEKALDAVHRESALGDEVATACEYHGAKS